MNVRWRWTLFSWIRMNGWIRLIELLNGYNCLKKDEVAFLMQVKISIYWIIMIEMMIIVVVFMMIDDSSNYDNNSDGNGWCVIYM